MYVCGQNETIMKHCGNIKKIIKLSTAQNKITQMKQKIYKLLKHTVIVHK